MQISFTGQYKSLNSFDWSDIPKFVVITGPNGSGKTQLLELIYESLTSTKPLEWAFLLNGQQFSYDEVVHLKGDWGVANIPAIDVGTIQNQHRALYTGAFSNFDRPNVSTANYRETEKKRDEYDGFTRRLGKAKRHHVTYEEFSEEYPKNILNIDVPINRQISNVFYNYHIAQIEASSKGFSKEEVTTLLGLPPWDVLRDIINVSKLPFKINDPLNLTIWDSFELKLTHAVTNSEIKFVDLSSGEKILLSIIFYLYQSQEKQIFPKLLIMDEPDAHLHPSMTQQFMNVVKDVLVNKFNIQIFMTTHSPSTVMFTPIESLFEMSISEPRIKRSPSKNHSVSLLTSGLIFVGDGTRYFLVEDRADVEFYSYVSGQLVVDDKITSDIPLVFIPASTNENTGGKSVVSSWVEKLRSSGLSNIIHGLIDKDSNNTAGNGIFTIDRYSIENYLIDPIVIYAALMEIGSTFPIMGITLSIGEEYKLKSLPNEKLQFIADTICSSIEIELPNHFTSYSIDKVTLSFINGSSLAYPRWLLECRGKTILNNICNRVFGGKINHGSLFKAFRRLNMVPLDLAEKLEEIQKNTASTN